MKNTTFLQHFLSLSAVLLLLFSVPFSASAQSLWGDANDDGQVTISDVVVLIDYVLTGDDSSINVENSDLDGDRVIGLSDITMLIDFILYGPPEDNLPQTETFTVEGVSFTVVYVRGGTFMMGPSTGTGDQAFRVTLSDYSISLTEVTQELWVAVMGYNPSWFSSNGGFVENLQRPVEQVDWCACQDFCAKLNKLTGRDFRLPTEAEWEYAARGGNRSHDYLFSGGNDIDEVGWYAGNLPPVEDWTEGGGTQPVAMKKPNELGIYDMTGNVAEWCQDWHAHYPSAPQTNPSGPSYGEYKLIRGGSVAAEMTGCYLKERTLIGVPYAWGANVGFRIVLSNQ